MTTDRWMDDYGLTPEEAAAIADDDALLDAIGSRSLDRAQTNDDSVARLLVSWVTDLDDLAADDVRVSSVKVAAPSFTVSAAAHSATVSHLDSRRAKALLAAGVVASGLLLPAGVAAAAGFAPTSPYRAVVTTVFGEPSAPELDSRGRLEAVQAAVARGDTQEAERLLSELKGSIDIGVDPEFDGMISQVEDLIEAVAAANSGNGQGNGQGNGLTNGNAKTDTAPGSQSAGKGKDTTKVPGSSANSNADGQSNGGGASEDAPGSVKATKAPGSPPATNKPKTPGSAGSATPPGKSGSAGSNGNGNSNS